LKSSLGRLGLLWVFVSLPVVAPSQRAITGLVRDATGAVLPGVMIEAASPVLIEKVRTAVTDEQGRYTIIDLRPGTYTVTIALTDSTRSRAKGSSFLPTSRPRSTPNSEPAPSKNRLR
jgi:hypothetical protein